MRQIANLSYLHIYDVVLMCHVSILSFFLSFSLFYLLVIENHRGQINVLVHRSTPLLPPKKTINSELWKNILMNSQLRIYDENRHLFDELI